MNTMMAFDDLERRVLANLNEAGEDYASALLNSVLRCTGADSEPVRLTRALTRLFKFGLVAFADSRDETTLEWNVLPHNQTVDRLEALPSHLRWETEQGFWHWNADDPRLTVLLTERGAKTSDQVLEKFGWDMTTPP